MSRATGLITRSRLLLHRLFSLSPDWLPNARSQLLGCFSHGGELPSPALLVSPPSLSTVPKLFLLSSNLRIRPDGLCFLNPSYLLAPRLPIPPSLALSLSTCLPDLDFGGYGANHYHFCYSPESPKTSLRDLAVAVDSLPIRYVETLPATFELFWLSGGIPQTWLVHERHEV